MLTPAIQSLAQALRPLKLLLTAVIVLPVGFFGASAWLNYQWAFEEAQARLSRTTDAVHEHALKVFETNELVLDRIAERLGSLGWNEIESDRTVHDYLAHLAEDVPHIAVLGFIDPGRRIVATNLDLPPVLAAEHDFLRVARENDEDLFISELSVGRYTHQPQFLVACYKPHGPRLPSAGMIFLSIRPEYFRKYYDTAFGQDYAISIIRADGAVLARYPDVQPGVVLAPETGFRRSIAERPERGGYSTASAIDGKQRLFSYRKLGPYPVYVTVGMDRATVVHRWLQKMSSHLLFGIPATLCLITLTVVALRRTARERAALMRANEEASRRKQLEASLYQAQKMEAVGQLTGGVAHDFNNLLTAIMGGLEMILNVRELAPPLRKHAAAAMRAAERGARLTQQLLAFSRQQMLRPEIVNVNRLLCEFETLMRRAVGESIDFTFTLDAEIAPSRVDPAQFQSAILNLVMNARDATPAGGRITIETRNVILAENTEFRDPDLAPGRYVVVSVSDTGTGMTPEVRAHAFDPFFTTKEVGKGSGLGLSQVYGFAKQSGGQVTVESTPRHGTTVRLYLPSVEAPAELRGEAAAHPAEAFRPATVLIVEDDDAVRETVGAALGALGYRTCGARDAAEALALLRQDDPVDLLFSDIVMPGGTNGIELARQARQLRQDLKVLLTTGYAAAAENKASDGFAILGKPYRQAQLAEKIASMLGGRG